MTSFKIVLPIVFLMVALSACGGDEPATPSEAEVLLTSAAHTAEADLTRLAEALQATPTPSATVEVTLDASPTLPGTPPTSIATQPATSPPTSGCDNAGFVADVTVPDGTEYDPGATFTKTWELSNDGSCTWTEQYQLVYFDGDLMSGPSKQAFSPGTAVAPGQTLLISVELTAPNTPGSYIGYWLLQNTAGENFGVGGPSASFWVQIIVSGTAAASDTPGASDTATPVPATPTETAVP